MKPFDKSSVSFGRHETFTLRFGWLTKGFKAWCEDPFIFEKDDATVVLGVGKTWFMRFAIGLLRAKF